MAKVSSSRTIIVVVAVAFILSTLLEGTLAEDPESFRFAFRFPRLPRFKLPKMPSISPSSVAKARPSVLETFPTAAEVAMGAAEAAQEEEED
uniref:Secreted protein n=1 Tax=Rhipicephalus zambeziensis TaxID=60191 RepID=A0A224YBG4_9ACAR